MKTRLQRLENSAKYLEAFELVKTIAKGEKNPYNYVYKWFKSVMETAKTEKENEKKASVASDREEALKKLAELNSELNITVEDDADYEEEAPEEELVG